MSNVTPPKKTPKPLTGARLRQTAFLLLSKREHSQQELYQKLTSYGAQSDEVNALIANLTEDNYQSDQRMADLLLREALRKGQGPNRLKQTLSKYSVDATPDTSDETPDWLTLARQTRQKKFGEALPTDPKEKARQYRFLLYRGFLPDVCQKALVSNPLDD